MKHISNKSDHNVGLNMQTKTSLFPTLDIKKTEIEKKALF